MKNLIIILVILLSLQATAQTVITLDNSAYFSPDENTKELVTEGYVSDFSVIRFNKEYTWFTHTTEDITSLYTITNMLTADTTDNIGMDIVSDTGNKYYAYVNFKDNVIVFYFDKNDDCGVFTIKSIYNEQT